MDAVGPAGGIVVGVPLNARYESDLPAIADKVTARTRPVHLVNPHNPTGTSSEAKPFVDFVRELSERTLGLSTKPISNSCPTLSNEQLPVRSGRLPVAVFRTFSMIYGLAGLSIGYVLAPTELAASLKQLGIGGFSNLNRLSLIAAKASLEDTGYVASIRAKLRAEHDAWHELFRERKVHFTQSQGNFIFFDSGRPHQVVAAALAAQGIEIGRGYPSLDTWVRISIGLPEENAVARRSVATLLRAG